MSKIKTFEEFINENHPARFSPRLKGDGTKLMIQLHFATNTKDIEKIRQDIMDTTGWDESDLDYMFKRFRNDIEYGGSEVYDPETAYTYDDMTNPNSTYVKFDRKHRPANLRPKTKKWDEAAYKEWIENMASMEGSDNAHEMALNAKYYPGLLDYVRKSIRKEGGDETSMERIQWDIENVN